MSIDLHTHSIYSDGTQSPAELVELAVNRRLRGLSLTDHDTTEGNREAVETGKALGIEVIPGLEISTRYDSLPLHILGYWVDDTDSVLADALLRLQQGREKRNKKIITVLQELGIAITETKVLRVSGRGLVGRPHIARVLIESGVVRNMHQAFDKFLKKGAPAYVARFAFSVEESIAMIHGAGGIAVLAHPGQIPGDKYGLARLLDILCSCGLDGIEAYYPSHSVQFRKSLVKMADRRDLVLTGGSDYHGDIRHGANMAGGKNVFVPPALIDTMKQKRDSVLDSYRKS
ncbi:MAG: PHP domain-containing protein [Thermodesulfobacteriota bacterium]